MKKDIHPTYQKAIVTCSCGNTFETMSTVPDIHVEICSVCHPFYTGKQKLVDTAGRVDKFRSRIEAANKIKQAKASSKGKSAASEARVEKIVDAEIKEIKEEIAEELVEEDSKKE